MKKINTNKKLMIDILEDKLKIYWEAIVNETDTAMKNKYLIIVADTVEALTTIKVTEEKND